MITVFGKSRKGAGKQGKSKSILPYKKPVGSPKPKQEEGCTVVDEWNKDRHVYTMFGKPTECCVKCGKENSLITEWRAGIASGKSENFGHPYVVRGYWSLDEYKKAMKKSGFIR